MYFLKQGNSLWGKHGGEIRPIFTKGLSINNRTISHPIFGPSLNAPQSKKPQHRPGYVSVFSQSFRLNLAQIWARYWEGYILTSPYTILNVDFAMPPYFFRSTKSGIKLGANSGKLWFRETPELPLFSQLVFLSRQFLTFGWVYFICKYKSCIYNL